MEGDAGVEGGPEQPRLWRTGGLRATRLAAHCGDRDTVRAANPSGGQMSGNPPLRTACLVVLVGAPASGKSTWARSNARGAVVVGQDELIDAITPGGFDHEYRPVYTAAEDAIARAALSEGHAVIVDRTNRT